MGLEQQRDEIPAYANTVAEHVDVIDLGIGTGFSRLSADRLPMKDEFIDEREDVQEALGRVRSGEYDVLVALDDTRIGRDEWFHVVEHAAAIGDCDIEYLVDVPDDDLSFSVNRVVEMRMKLREMEKSQKAKMARQKQGLPDGRPPFGLQYNTEKTGLVPDEDFNTALEILRLDDEGESQRGIAREVEPSRSVVRRVLQERDRYESHQR